MTRHEAIEILKEVKMLDDSMFAYSQAYNDALDMAIEALKAQEPRLMTLEDAINSETVWVECTNGDGGYGTCRLVEIYGMVAAEVFMLKNKYPERKRLNPEKYLREWRCWTSRPTDAQREATPWTQTNGSL